MFSAMCRVLRATSAGIMTMYTLLSRRFFGNCRSRHVKPQRRLKRDLTLEALGRRDLLTADVGSGLSDDRQDVVVEDIAWNQAIVNNYVVHVASSDTFDSSVVADPTASQPWVDNGSSPLRILACVYKPVENPARHSLDVDAVMVGGLGGEIEYEHGGDRHAWLSPSPGDISLNIPGSVDLFFEAAGNEVVDDLDDPDLIDSDGLGDENLAGPEDDLELVAMAGSGGGGYGGYGGEAPEISSFVGAPDTGFLWSFAGIVSDNADPTGLTVTLQGIIETTTVIVGENDTFGVSVYVAPEEFGWVCATVTDENGVTSAAAWFFVDNT